MELRKTSRRLLLLGLCAHAFFVSISIAGMQIALGVAAVGLLLLHERPARSPLDRPLLAFAALAIASDLYSPFGPPALAFATLWRAALGYLIVFQGVRLLEEDEVVPRLLGFAALGLALSSGAGLVEYWTGIDLVHALHLRAGSSFVEAPGVPGRYGAMGFFTSRLSFGHNACVLLALLSGALSTGAVSRRLRAPVAAAVALAFVAILLTFDRAGWLALAAAALAIVAFAPRARKLLLPVLAAALLLGALNPAVRARFRSSFDAGANGDRLFLWQRAFEIIRDHPLAGIGFANYPRVCPAYYDRVDSSFPMRTWAHNSELDLLAEMGPLGLLAFLWVVLAAARALLRSRSPLATGALAAGAALLVIAQAHDVFYDTKVMYALWLSLALGTAAPRGSPSATAGSAGDRSPPGRTTAAGAAGG